MAFKYSPLAKSVREIRLLTISLKQTDLPDQQEPLKCLLEHVELEEPLAKHASAERKRYIGYSYSWSEAYKTWDYSNLYRDRSWLEQKIYHEPEQWSPSESLAPAENESTSLWRYSWGDYVALSYAWGDPKPEHAIILNGDQFKVNDNLYHALLQLRRSVRIEQGFKIWIDAICINQADRSEKNQQVPMMQQIYSLAWQVVIWLGPAANDSHLAMTALHWLACRLQSGLAESNSEIFDTTRKLHLSLVFKWYVTLGGSQMWRTEVFTSLYYLFMRSYWRRLWILQEIVMAREDAPVLCGDQCLLWRDIHNAARYLALNESKFTYQVELNLGRWETPELTRNRDIDRRYDSPERSWRLIMEMTKLQHDQRQTELPSSPQEIVTSLLLAREADVTLQQDRVYGILAIKGIATHVRIKPDYGCKLSHTYQLFTQEFLAAGTFDLLRLVHQQPGPIYSRWKTSWGDFFFNVHGKYFPLLNQVLQLQQREVIPKCNHDLPSWVVCWTCKALPVAQLPGSYRAGGTGTSSSKPRFCTSNVPAIMTVRGMILDAVTSMSTFNALDAGNCSTRHPGSHNGIKSAYGDLTATRDAFMRTVTGNTTQSGAQETPQSYRSIFEPIIWRYGLQGFYMSTFDPKLFMEHNGDLELSGFTLKELIFGSKSDDISKQKKRVKKSFRLNQEEMEAVSWMVNVMAWRRLVSTDRGRMGLCPAAGQIGDRVAVISGCSMPMLLRPRGNRWTLIGEAYIHGIMTGEALASSMATHGIAGNIDDIDIS